MNLPVPPNHKYGLIALDGAAAFEQPIDLGNGYFALARRLVELPAHWKEWLGTVRTDRIERAGLVLLATVPTERPEDIDADNDLAGRRVDNLFWGLLAAGHLRFEGEGTRLTGAHGAGGIDVRQESGTMLVVRLRGINTSHVSEADCRRAALLAEQVTTLLGSPGMLRLKLALRTFMVGFSEYDLGERIHQFVRAMADGIANSWRNDEFRRKSALFVGDRDDDLETCRELYMMRSNAEHFNEPDERIEPRLPVREGLLRGYRRALQSEFLARYCFTRVLERPSLWQYFVSKDRLDDFWNLDPTVRAELWGPPMDLAAALSPFDPSVVPDER
jgi:hypothetical protein